MSTGNRVPSLDGLRAASITLVLLSHSFNESPGSWTQPLRVIVGNGQLGVSVFFVISGYLITMLLVREWARPGRSTSKSSTSGGLFESSRRATPTSVWFSY